MPTMRRLTVLVGSLSLVSLAACGSTPPPPAKEPPAAETFPEVNPADLAQLTPPAEASNAPAPAPKVDAPVPAPEGPVDECTPVGVDFEKRARPKVKDCYAQAKKKNPELRGSVRISVDVDTLGKIRSTTIADKTLPDPVAQCMLKAVKETPFPEAKKCAGKAVTIPVTFPTPP